MSRARQAVYTRDRADEAAFALMLAEAGALRELDAELTQDYGVPGMVEDLWRAAYCRRPELLELGELEPRAHINRTIVAAQVGSPEHTELRRSTCGDAFLSALAVVTQAAALRRMLGEIAAERAQAAAAEDAREQAPDGGDGQAGGAGDDAGGASGSGGAAAGPGEDGQDTDADSDSSGGSSGGASADEEDGTEDGEGHGAAGREVEPGEDEQEGDVDGDAAVAAQQLEADLDAALQDAPIRSRARRAAQAAADEIAAEGERAAAWGVGEGDLQRMSADDRMALGRRLASEKLRAFAELIGRFRQLARAQRARRVEHVRGEYVGVTLGDDLSSLIPAELANLAVPALRAEFAARYAEQRLMVYDQRGEEHEAQGAVIALVDCSYSMTDPLGEDWSPARRPGNTAEAYAKALTLALLAQARAATPTREFAAILFTSEVDATFRFPADRPVAQTDRIEMAARFAGGGTDFMGPLEAATALLAEEYNTTGKQKADIVLITDGDAPVSEDWLQRWRQDKRRLDFRAFGVEIGPGGSPTLPELCDDVRRIDEVTGPHAAADLFRSI